MRTILNIDETLLAQARLLTDIESKSKLVREVPVARWWNGIARVISRVSTVVS